MALVLGMRLGDVFDIGESWIKARSVNRDRTVTIMISDGRTERISSRTMREIFPEVFIGLGPQDSRQIRLVFIAPRHVHITRRGDA